MIRNSTSQGHAGAAAGMGPELGARDGRLEIEDSNEASRIFWSLLLWDSLHGRLVGAIEPLEQDQIDVMARRAVARFMQLFGPGRNTSTQGETT